MTLLEKILAAFSSITANDEAMSVLFGLVISLAGTQYLKFRVPVPTSVLTDYRWFVRLVSLPLGFFPTYFSWPGKHRLLVALCIGLAAPIAYKIAVSVLYWKWPELEKRLSAAPSKETA